MKNIYVEPQIEVLEIEIEDAVLSDSGDESGNESVAKGASWGGWS